MKNLVLPALIAVCAACGPQAGRKLPAQAGPVVFPWLHGDWIIDAQNTTVVERWQQESATLLTGSGYVISGPDTVVQELMRIEKIGSTWVFIAQVNNGRPVLFSSAQTESDTVLVFTNPEHDFPRQVTYRKGSADSLVASVSGKEHGNEKSEQYAYTRPERK